MLLYLCVFNSNYLIGHQHPFVLFDSFFFLCIPIFLYSFDSYAKGSRPMLIWDLCADRSGWYCHRFVDWFDNWQFVGIVFLSMLITNTSLFVILEFYLVKMRLRYNTVFQTKRVYDHHPPHDLALSDFNRTGVLVLISILWLGLRWRSQRRQFTYSSFHDPKSQQRVCVIWFAVMKIRDSN